MTYSHHLLCPTSSFTSLPGYLKLYTGVSNLISFLKVATIRFLYRYWQVCTCISKGVGSLELLKQQRRYFTFILDPLLCNCPYLSFHVLPLLAQLCSLDGSHIPILRTEQGPIWGDRAKPGFVTRDPVSREKVVLLNSSHP